jgi:Sec-independent protein translocase protein TatA
MTIFGIGTLELVLILLLLILIFGPERITEMARWLGQSYRKLTGVTNEINQQVSQVRQAMNTAVDTKSLTNPLSEVTEEIKQAQQDLTQELDKTQEKIKSVQSELDAQVILPPITVEEEAPSEVAEDTGETEGQD